MPSPENTWNQFAKNLILFAPNKGEAKKTVSRGLIRLEMEVIDDKAILIQGAATDDIASIYMSLYVPTSEAATVLKRPLLKEVLKEDFIGYWEPEQLKLSLTGPLELPAQPAEASFDKKFWVEHVFGSIYYDHVATLLTTGVSFNPDRMRKLALMEPRGAEVQFWFVEWADRSIIRWNTETARGAYAPVGMW